MKAWIAGCCLTLPVLDAQAAASLTDLMACRLIADSGSRLACFDRETAALARTAGPATPATSATPPAPPKSTANGVLGGTGDATKDFGLSSQAIIDQHVAAGERPREVTQIEALLARITLAADGRVIFTLNNGQQWRELSAQGDLLAQVGQSVTISRELFGSYFLRAASGRGCKVARLEAPISLSR